MIQGGGGGALRPFMGKDVMPAPVKNHPEWFLIWKIIPLFEWDTVKNTISGTILFTIL